MHFLSFCSFALFLVAVCSFLLRVLGSWSSLHAKDRLSLLLRVSEPVHSASWTASCWFLTREILHSFLPRSFSRVDWTGLDSGEGE